MRGEGGTVEGQRGTEGAEWLHYVSRAEWTAGRGSPRTLAFRGLVRRGGRPQHRGHKIAEGQWRGILRATLPGVDQHYPWETERVLFVRVLRELLQRERWS